MAKKYTLCCQCKTRKSEIDLQAWRKIKNKRRLKSLFRCQVCNDYIFAQLS